jgi:hypothetical protein
MMIVMATRIVKVIRLYFIENLIIAYHIESEYITYVSEGNKFLACGDSTLFYNL